MKDYLQLENQHVKRLFEKKNGKIDTLSPLTEKEDLKAFNIRLKKDLNQNWKDTSEKIKLLNKSNNLRNELYIDISIVKSNIDEILYKESYLYDFEYNPNQLIQDQDRNKWIKELYPDKDPDLKKKIYLRNLLAIVDIEKKIFKTKNVNNLLKLITETKILVFLDKSPSAIHRLLREIYINKIKTEKEKRKKREDIEGNVQLPNITDINFQDKILVKKEFVDHKIKNLLIQNSDNIFAKTSTQKLLMNFISPNTPYNSILLWHGVGTGKTCSAISIAEQFKNRMIFFKKKILIILPGNTLTDNWISEIFNVKKQLDNDMKSVQCTENNYINYFFNLKNKYIIDQEKENKYFSEYEIDDMSPIEIKRKLKDKDIPDTELKKELYNQQYKKLLKYLNNQMKKYIEEFYEITTYQKITNILKDKLFNKTEKEKLDYIRTNYSDRLIIMDEIHIQNDIKMDKLSNNYLELICRYGNNNKLILLSATPIRDNTSEILSILNLILLNEKKSTMLSSDYFSNNKDKNENKKIYNLKKNKKKDFEKKIEGYISYLRGSDPETFPVKLYPDWNPKTINKKVFIPSQIENDLKEQKISFKLSPVKCYGNQGNKEYLKNYNEKIPEKSPLQHSQYANIVFPGSTNLNSLLKNPTQLNKVLHKDYDLKITSPKFFNILTEINRCKGISFVFTQFINEFGIRALATILELHGFNRLSEDGKNITNNGKKQNNGKKLNYILLTGETSDQKKTKLINLCKSPDNKNGENIKVILGSPAVEQGISFFNIRQIHITEPWWNFSRIEQAIGRGVRNFSHIKLEKSKRNVMIFLHCTPDTVDEEMYYNAYLKKKAIMLVDKIMKNKAIDECINLDINYISDEKSILIKDCYNIKGNYVVKNVDYSFECELEKCNYQLQKQTCNEKKYESNDKSFILDNVKVNFILYKYFIQNLYNDNYFYTFIELKKKIKEIYKLDINITQYLSYALDKLIKDREILYIKDQKGFLIYRNKYYIFQPIFSSIVDEADISMPLYNRMITYHKKKKFNINDLGIKLQQGDTTDKSDEKSIEDKDLYDKFKDKFAEIALYVDVNFNKYKIKLPHEYQRDTSNILYWTDILKIVVKFYLFDHLLFNEKKIIFSEITKEIKNMKQLHKIFEKGVSNVENIKTYFMNKNPDNDLYLIFIWYYGKNINNTAFSEYCVFFDQEKFRLYDEDGNMKVYDFNGNKSKNKRDINKFNEDALIIIKTKNVEVGYLQSERNKKLITVKNTEKVLSGQTGKNAINKQAALEKYKHDYDNLNNYEGKFLLFNYYKVDEIDKDGRVRGKSALCGNNKNFNDVLIYANKLIKDLHIYSKRFYDPPKH